MNIASQYVWWDICVYCKLVRTNTTFGPLVVVVYQYRSPYGALKFLAFFELLYILVEVALTCKHFLSFKNYSVCRLWKQKCKQARIEEEPVSPVKSVRRRSNTFQQTNPNNKAVNSPFKKLFMTKQRVYWNWRMGPLRPSKVLKGHDDHVITCLQFCGSKIVSGSDDGTLKVWSAISGKCLRTLVGHTGGVWSSQLSGNTIVSGSTDRTLKVWNADTGHCMHTLYGHSSTVRCMDMHDGTVVSGSRDGTLRVWDTSSGNCLHVLVGHLAAVRWYVFALLGTSVWDENYCFRILLEKM